MQARGRTWHPAPASIVVSFLRLLSGAQVRLLSLRGSCQGTDNMPLWPSSVVWFSVSLTRASLVLLVVAGFFRVDPDHRVPGAPEFALHTLVTIFVITDSQVFVFSSCFPLQWAILSQCFVVLCYLTQGFNRPLPAFIVFYLCLLPLRLLEVFTVLM